MSVLNCLLNIDYFVKLLDLAKDSIDEENMEEFENYNNV
jgi:hypothetical protein